MIEIERSEIIDEMIEMFEKECGVITDECIMITKDIKINKIWITNYSKLVAVAGYAGTIKPFQKSMSVIDYKNRFWL